MSTFTAIEVDKLPAPDVFEQLSFEQIYAERIAAWYRLAPDYGPLYESDPVTKLLQENAYRELLLREQFNERAKGMLLPYARGGDLDNLAIPFGVARKLLSPADPQTGADAVYESDTDFRRRIQLAPEGLSVAGPEGAYIFHALSADPDVLDASVTSPSPGEVLVTVLSRTGDGTAAPALVDAVASVLTHGNVRPLTDHVTVRGAQVVGFEVVADLYTYNGPDAASRAVNYLLRDGRRLGTQRIEHLTVPIVQRIIETLAVGRPAHGALPAIKATPAAANRVKSYLQRLFAWGIRHGHCTTNPADGVRKVREKRDARMPEHSTFDAVLAFAKKGAALTAHAAGSWQLPTIPAGSDGVGLRSAATRHRGQHAD